MADSTRLNMDIDMIEAELELDATKNPATEENNSNIDSSAPPASANDEEHYNKLFSRPEGIFLYGLDTMNTDDIHAYCQKTALKKVEWIDDSSCVLVFDNESDATAAAQELSLESLDTGLNTTDLRKAKPFHRTISATASTGIVTESIIATDGELQNQSSTTDSIDSVPTVNTLEIRMATDNDVKKRGSRSRSRYYLLRDVLGTDQLPSDKTNSVFSRLGSRVAPSTTSHRQRQDSERDRYNSNSKYDQYSRRRRYEDKSNNSDEDNNNHRSRRRSVSPFHTSSTSHSSDDTDGVKAEDSAQVEDKPIEIPEHLRGRLGKIA